MERGVKEEIAKVRKARKRAIEGIARDKIAKLHEEGRLTARERLEIFFDKGSFVELGLMAESQGYEFGMKRHRYPTDGVIIGHGTVDGRQVCAYSEDVTILGGSVGVFHGRKMTEIADLAIKTGVPLVALMESPGARVQEAISEVIGPPNIFYQNVRASGVVPQIAVVLGNTAGMVIYSAALMDFIFMVDKQSHALITGPKVIKTIGGGDITMEELAGAKVHSVKTGICDYRARDEMECLRQVRSLLSFLPSNNLEESPVTDTGDDPHRWLEGLEDIVPVNPELPFDMHQVIERIVDNGDFFEVKKEFAPCLIVGFGRLNGRTIGIVANQPENLSGCLTVDSSDKFARFVRFCDCFNIPVVFLVDVPGYLPGIDQEHTGIINHGAKVLYALCEATVPKVSVVIRKCYGGGMLAMGGHKSLRIDQAFGWPTAELATMGAEAAVNFLYRDELKRAQDPEKMRGRLLRKYKEEHSNPLRAAAKRFLDDVIEPRETRIRLIQSLELLSRKNDDPLPRRKHGNIPL